MKIKGNTQIILTDAKTGKVVKRTNDDNMVTNGVFEFIRSHGMTVTDLFNNAEIKNNPLTTLLGGVYLFHDSQTENVNNFKPDGGNALTANGAYDVSNSQGRTLGNFNASESGWMSDSIFRFVYDWTSAQGNGVISSVSLTSRIAGMLGLGKNVKPLSNVYLDSYTTYNVTFNERTILHDDSTTYDYVFGIDGNYLYSYHFQSDSNSPSLKSLVIHRQHICNTEMAFDDSGSLKPLSSSKVEYVASFPNVGNDTEGNSYPVIHAYGYYWMLMSYTKIYTAYEWVEDSPSQGHTEEHHQQGIAWRVLKIKDDFSACEACEIDGDGGMTEPYYPSNVFGLTNNWAERLNQLMNYQLDRQAGFFPTSDNTFVLYACRALGADETHASPWFTYKLYNVTFDTQTVVDGGFVHSYSQNYAPTMYLFGSVMHHANGISYGQNWVGTEDGDLWECDVFRENGRAIGCKDESLFGYLGGNGNVIVGRDADYLATVNNLSSAVTKDNTQNMKLIYTLTFTD